MLAQIIKPKHVRLQLCWVHHRALHSSRPSGRKPTTREGRTTGPETDPDSTDARAQSHSPFYFETGYSIFAKRPSRPFPPPFVSLPSGSFSDPLTTHHSVRDRRPSVNGQLIRGITNGDDAVLIGGQHFLGVNDGVGAWAQKERGHAALWSRLIAHFWDVEVEKAYKGNQEVTLEQLNMVKCLQEAYGQTKAVTSTPNEILGTTTASSALLHHRTEDTPVILATTLGDCAVLVVRPGTSEVIYRSTEQWHWFDCPRQLGTNSPDSPDGNAVTDVVDIHEGDLVLVLSDGVTDNLWEHEISEKVSECFKRWRDGDQVAKEGVVYVARELMNAAREIAEDPDAESPYMERALDEGIAAEGGKLDDISVVIGWCQRRK